MRFHGTANGGITAPAGQPRVPVQSCCAKCIRGTKAMRGECGYDLLCACHTAQNVAELSVVLDRLMEKR